MNLTARKAWELSMLKWEFFSTFDYASVYDMVETVDELEDAFPQLIKLFANCGFCEKYIDEDKTEACSRCGKCPIYKSDPEQSCLEDDSKYAKWEENPSRRTARSMLKLIRSLEPKRRKK